MKRIFEGSTGNLPPRFNFFEKWVLTIRFVKAALNESERQGGIKAFPIAQKDILETMADDLDKKANELADKKLLDLLSPVDYKQVATIDKKNGILYIGNEKVTPEHAQNLKAEAEFFTNSDLWKIIYNSPKEIAERTMFVSSESLADLQKGKSMLYCLDSQKKIIDLMKQIK